MNSPSDTPTVERLLAERAWLERLARTLVVGPAEADDLAQDATVIALTKPPRAPGALRGWLRRVATNLARNAHRGDTRRAAREAATARPEAADDDPAEIAARWEIRRRVVDAVLSLDEPYRTTLLLRFFEGLDLAEAARRLDVPAETVRTRQRRALEALRVRLADLDDGAGRRGRAVLLVLARSGVPRSPAPATTTSAAALFGGIAMSALGKSLAAAAVLLSVAAAWWALRERPDDDASSAVVVGDAETTSAGRQRTGRAARETVARPAGDDLATNLAAPGDLDAERDIFGVVVDRDDRPVAGAVVTAHGYESIRHMLAVWRNPTPSRSAAIERATSAEDGSFRLRIAPGAQALVRTTAAGFADAEYPGATPGRRLLVVLAPPMTLRVRVTEEGGGPAAGALVLASCGTRGAAPGFTRRRTTRADGVVEWDGLPRPKEGTADLLVSVTLEGRAETSLRASLSDLPVNEVKVQLASGRTVEGRVVDLATGAGIPGARVGTDPALVALATADASGRFRIGGWTAGAGGPSDRRNRFVALAEGYAPGAGSVPLDETGEPFEIPLTRGFDVTGTIVDASGAPVGDAVVLARAGASRTVLDTASAADGRFRLGWFPRSARTPLHVEATGCATVFRLVEPPPADTPTLDLGTIVVAAGRVVRGRVVDAAGKGLEDYVVRLEQPGDAEGELTRHRTTAADGRFAFADVGAGRRRIAAWPPRGVDVKTSADVDVPADRDPEPVTLVFGQEVPKAPAKVVLRTRILDEDGRPVPGIRFAVGYGGGGSHDGFLTADEHGRIDVPCAEQPQYVSPRLEGETARTYLYSFTWLRPGSTSVDVVLRRGEPVGGVVLDVDGKPAANAWVEALVGNVQVGSGGSDAQGRFAFAVPPGSVVDLEATAAATSYPPPTDIASRSGVAAGTTDVTLQLARVPRGRSLDVVLVLPESAVAGNCDVGAYFAGADNRRPIRAAFDERGRARLENLPRGPVRLRVQVRLAGDDKLVHTGLTPVRVGAEESSVRIVVPGFRVVRGRVVESSGEPSPGAHLFSTGGYAGSGAVADSAGRFTLRCSADAKPPFLVTASPMPFDRTAPRGGWEIVEDDDESREIEIVLQPSR